MSDMTLEQRLFRLLQDGIPIESRPFERIGEILGCDSGEALSAIKDMTRDGLIREISPVFSPRHLGYLTTLCGACISPNHVRIVAAQLNSLPEVTHNYLRDHPRNLWFTLVAPNAERTEAIIEATRTSTGVEEVLSFPAKAMFKIAPRFSLKPGDEQDQVNTTQQHIQHHDQKPLSKEQIDIVRALQNPLPLSEQPFREIAAEMGLAESALLEQIRQWIQDGIIRRFGARVRHRLAGYNANAMAVWVVPDDAVQRAGALLSRLPEVSHCYERQPYPQWHFNLYAMVHGAERQAVQQTLSRVSQEINCLDHAALFSVEEFKKSAPRYF